MACRSPLFYPLNPSARRLFSPRYLAFCVHFQRLLISPREAKARCGSHDRDTPASHLAGRWVGMARLLPIALGWPTATPGRWPELFGHAAIFPCLGNIGLPAAPLVFSSRSNFQLHFCHLYPSSPALIAGPEKSFG